MSMTCAAAPKLTVCTPVVAAQRGMSLIEVLASLLIFSFGVLGLIGMQARVIGDSMDAEYRVQASYLANRLIGQMWTDRDNLIGYADGALADAWKDEVGQALPGATGGNAPTVIVSGSQVDITMRWQRAADGEIRSFRTTAYINGPL